MKKQCSGAGRKPVRSICSVLVRSFGISERDEKRGVSRVYDERLHDLHIGLHVVGIFCGSFFAVSS